MKNISLIILFIFSLCCTAVASSSSLELVSTNFTGNTNSVFSPGGTFGLSATITAVNQAALNATATLNSPDPCVTIAQGSTAYGTISVSQNASNAASPFQFSISTTCPTGHLINLTLTMAADSYSSTPIIIPILVSVPSVPYITPPYTCRTNYYVSTHGSDLNNGTSVGQAWFSLTHAISYLSSLGGTHGGVCVNVQPGTYNESNYAFGLGGSSDTPGGYLVFRSMMLHGATVQVPAANASNPSTDAFRFDQEHYIVVDGFNLVGQVIPGSRESGIVSNGYGTPGDHLKVINNILADHGGAGVAVTHTDYFVAEGNIIFGNANTSPNEESGISSWQAVASDTAPGFHNIISDNIVFNNAEINNGLSIHEDGNGIIIDDFRNTQNGSTYGIYAPQTLIENNLVFGNGARGIHVYSSNNVTLLNNTTLDNALDPIGLGTWRPELDAVNSANILYANNIAVALEVKNQWNAPNVSFLDISTDNSNINNLWANNLSFNGTVGQASIFFYGTHSTITSAKGNKLGQNPKFVNPGLNEFTLQSGSPAILAGTNAYGYPPDDLAGNVRSAGTIDMGAFQYSNISVYPLTVSNVDNGFGMMFGSTATNSNLINCGVNPGATICNATLNSGTPVTLTATAASGSGFSGWTVTGAPAGTCTGTTNPCLVTVTAATNVTADFKPLNLNYTLNASAGPGGTINPAGTVKINYGASQTLTVTPFAGYMPTLKIDGIAVVLTNNKYTLSNVSASHIAIASFSLPTETITASAGTGGSISPSGPISVNYGANQIFTLTPNAGYTATLVVDGTAVTLTNNKYTLIAVTASHTVTANFTSSSTEPITASAGTGGTISPSGTVAVNGGADQTFTVTPNAGYNSTLKVDGTAVTLTNNAYTLNNVTTPHTVVASFSLQTEAITASAGDGGTIYPAGTVNINYGASLTLIVTPFTGYTPILKIDGVAVPLTSNKYILSNITQAHTVKASFHLS